MGNNKIFMFNLLILTDCILEIEAILIKTYNGSCFQNVIRSAEFKQT
jgi:hypothetical protein